MTALHYRAPAVPVSVLAEVASPHFGQRFDACVAVSATVWGHGLRSCRTPAEVREWMDSYLEHLELTRDACLKHRGGANERQPPGNNHR